MNSYQKRILSLTERLKIHSITSFSWFDQLTPRLPTKIEQVLSPDAKRTFLKHAIQMVLYSDFYCKGDVIISNSYQSSHTVGKESLVNQLSDANSGSGYLSKNWKIISEGTEYIVLEKGGLRLFEKVDADHLVRKGKESCSIRFPKEQLNFSPGFYMAVGNKELKENVRVDLIRIYWNLDPNGAPEFINLITKELNNQELPFRVKILNDPGNYNRCDSAVLYCKKEDFNLIAKVLPKHIEAITRYLKPKIPVFTKELHPGIGLAENPPNGESFGLHRCELVAEGLVRAFERKISNNEQRLSMIEQVFKKNRVDLNFPYLNPQSNDNYTNFKPINIASLKNNLASDVIDSNTSSKKYIEVAKTIGNQLCMDSIWYNGICNWLGITQYSTPNITGVFNSKLESLGYDVYSGSSGIALFLAQLYRLTGEEIFKKTALGAIGHSIKGISENSSLPVYGFFQGKIGIAFSMSLIGHYLIEDEFIEKAEDFLCSLSVKEIPPQYFDVISGAAGGILALLALSYSKRHQTCLQLAENLGVYLGRHAVRTNKGISWPSPHDPKQRNLLGFSHGAAGIAYAFAELYNHTKNISFLQLSRDAFEYEKSWYSHKQKNWPDFRGLSHQHSNKVTPTFQQSWCHGAPGIALARMRPYSVLKDNQLLDSLRIGLETTATGLERSLKEHVVNYCLCHGLAGNSEILYIGMEYWSEKQEEFRRIVDLVANTGLNMYGDSGKNWPCGTRYSPNLMVGTAGIGYFYLRLAFPKVPSLLQLSPDDFF